MVNCNRPTTLTFMGRRVLVVDDDVLRREVNARLSGNSFRASAELPILPKVIPRRTCAGCDKQKHATHCKGAGNHLFAADGVE